MSAHGSAIGKAPASQRAKDTGFRLTMLACLGLSVGLLALLLYDVVKDGASHLTIDFLTSFGSISADKAGAEAAIWGTIWIMVVCARVHRARWAWPRRSTSRSTRTTRAGGTAPSR